MCCSVLYEGVLMGVLGETYTDTERSFLAAADIIFVPAPNGQRQRVQPSSGTFIQLSGTPNTPAGLPSCPSSIQSA